MQFVLLTCSAARDKLANNGTKIDGERIVAIESSEKWDGVKKKLPRNEGPSEIYPHHR
jgi:hypothetical protein